MKYALILFLFVFAGCQHVPPTVFVREVPVQVTTTNYLDVIRFPSAYKAYTVGRRPDASNPAVMHESHILYIRETPDRWNLQPTAAPAVPPVNTAASPDATVAPLPVSEQLRLEVQKQQKLSQSLADQNQRVEKSADELVPAVRKAVELNLQFQQRQQALEERLRRLEEAQRPSSFTNWPGVTVTNR